MTHCGAQTESRPKVEAALLVHGVLKAWQLRQSWPIVVERVIAQTVVSAEEAKRESIAQTNESRIAVDSKMYLLYLVPFNSYRRVLPMQLTLSACVSCMSSESRASIVRCIGSSICISDTGTTHSRYLCNSLQLHRDQ